jgi:hypothetical protein
MSGRVYPNKRIAATAEELQAYREEDRRDREHERKIKELKRKIELERLQQEHDQMQAAVPSPQRDRDLTEERAAEPPEPSRAKPGSGRRGPRDGTLAAGAALHRYLKDKGDTLSLTPASLAREAADYATELGLPLADLLSPEGSTMQQMAESMLVAHRHKGK